MTSIVNRLRKFSGTLHGPMNDDMREAADIIELLMSRFTASSVYMDGQHSYVFHNQGWPMTHAKGPTPEQAIFRGLP